MIKPFNTGYTHKTVALPEIVMGAAIAEYGINLTEEQKSTAYVIGSPELRELMRQAAWKSF